MKIGKLKLYCLNSNKYYVCVIVYTGLDIFWLRYGKFKFDQKLSG